MRSSRWIVLAWLSAVLALSGTAGGQTVTVTGGLQEVPWTKDQNTAQSFVNGTRLGIASFWIGIGNDGVANTPELRTIEVVAASATWHVDDNEDGDNNDANETNNLDETPASALPNGWHRVQAPETPSIGTGRIAVGGSFTIRLADENGSSLVGRSIFLIPAWTSAGGDNSTRIEAPFVISQALPSAQVVIEGINAPPGSTTFVAMLTNADPLSALRRVRVDPPPTTSIASVAATGATYDGVNRILTWPSALTPSASSRLTVSLTSVGRLLTTVVTFVGIEFISPPAPAFSCPALPEWGFVGLVAALLAGGFLVLRRRG
jgi:hypothetical protein